MRSALIEDRVAEDLTTHWSVASDLQAAGDVIARSAGVVAGVSVAEEVYRQVDPESVHVYPMVSDGTYVAPGERVLRLEGSARSIISGERVALNFLQRMSGIATLARRMVEAVEGLPVRILDTRKTAPGLRLLDKYAVRVGGADNHRMNLATMVLLKENHISAAGSITAAVASVRDSMSHEGRRFLIGVEVRDTAEAIQAMAAGVDRILLDNMSLADMAEVVDLNRRGSTELRPTLEASGNITLDTVRAVAETGVDAISSGSLTHSVTAFDLTMLVRPSTS